MGLRAHVGGGQDVLIPAFAALSLLGGLGYGAVRRRFATHTTAIGILLLAVLVVQLAWIGGHPTHLVPTPADQRAGQRFVAMVASTPGQVIVLDHPWVRHAGRETIVGPRRSNPRRAARRSEPGED